MANSPENQNSFSLTIGSEEISLNIKTFEISLSESIYTLCPQATFTMNDFSGIMMESRLKILGQDVAFTMSDTSATTMLPMTCVLYETNKCNSSDGLSGIMTMKFKHTAKFSPREAKGWANKSPAEVFRELMQKMNQRLNSRSRNSLRNPLIRIAPSTKCIPYPLLFNPAYDNEEFIDKILLPIASSGDVSATPFCAFIDVTNKAHFDDISTMYEKSPIRNLVFGNDPNRSIDTLVVLTLQSFSQDYNHISGILDERLVYLNENNEISSSDVFLSNVFNPIAVMRNTSTVSLCAPKDYSDIINRDEEIAKLNYERRKGVLIDKLVISTFMDLNLCAGRTVNLDTYLNINSSEKAPSYSGKFLIEASEHLWDPNNMLGYTHLVLGRPDLEVKGKETG